MDFVWFVHARAKLQELSHRATRCGGIHRDCAACTD